MADVDDAVFIRVLGSKLAEPEFLQGLESWLHLGLLTDKEVRKICRLHLACTLPPPPSRLAETLTVSSVEKVPVPLPSLGAGVKPRFQTLQNFMSEVSVIWFLFLGVFLVVVSSGVFAANQWQNSPPTGQYGILLTYTLAFAGASWWASRQQNLQLTARMIQFATLLIIPVNFWMMDGLRLWNDGLGLGLSIGAAGLLSIISFSILRHLTLSAELPLVVFNSWALSWLHWGWSFSLMPVVATYLGTLITTFVVFWQYRHNQRAVAAGLPTANAGLAVSMALTVAVLMVRSIFLYQVPIAQLGLAFGSCGWLLCWLSRQSSHRVSYLLGISLLLLGWGVSVQTMPIQALGVSLLGCTLLLKQLQQQLRTRNLLALWLLGLQTLALTSMILPLGWQDLGTKLAIQLFGASEMPEAMRGVVGLVYVGVTLLLAEWLGRQGATRLDSQAQGLAGLLAVCLTLISAANSGMLAMNLSFSTGIVIAVILRRRSAATATYLIYLLQMTAIATIAAWIYFAYPAIGLSTWGWLATAGAVLEWSGTLGRRAYRWRQSAWYLGIGLASMGYLLLLVHAPSQFWWFCIPLSLTILSKQRLFCGDAFLAATLSSIAVILQLFLLTPGLGMIGVAGLCTLLMLKNTTTLHTVAASGLTVGMALLTNLLMVQQYFSPILNVDHVVWLAALQSWLLWLAWGWLRRNNSVLRDLYVRATDAWAMGIAISTYVVIGLSELFIVGSGSMSTTVGVGLLGLAHLYRLRLQPQEIVWYLLAINGGCLAFLLVNSWTSLAVVLLVLGLVSQLAGDLWSQRSGQVHPRSWQQIPLMYGVLGLVVGHQQFLAHTGLLTLASALIGVGVGRRSPAMKAVVLMAIAMISVGLYELLIFQMLQVPGGHAGDGVMVLAGLAILLAWLYRLSIPWSQRYFQLAPLEIQFVGHLHWLIAGILGLALPSIDFVRQQIADWAWLLPGLGGMVMSDLHMGNIFPWLAVMLGCSFYALAMGNERGQLPKLNLRAREVWTYLGILLVVVTGSFGVLYLPENSILASKWGVLAATVIAWRIYQINWVRWGWPLRPWQQAAMVLPIATVLLTAQSIAGHGLVIAAAFYGWLALSRREWRISYLSLGLLNWAMLSFLMAQHLFSLLWGSALLGVSLLLVAQVEPLLQDMAGRDRRHWLRVIAAGQMIVNSFYQAEVVPELIWAVVPLFLSLGLVLLGLRYQVRAFLYIGTLAFLLRILRLLWLFTNQYWLAIWGVGIVLGLVMIWVAATFEARRSQINDLTQRWLTELNRWE